MTGIRNAIGVAAMLATVSVAACDNSPEPEPIPLPQRSVSALPPPTGLTVTATTSTSAWFRWNPLPDIMPASYVLMRDGEWACRTHDGATTVCAVSQLKPSEVYVFTVHSEDRDGNLSLQSEPVTVSTAPVGAELISPVRHFQVTTVTPTSITVYWSPPAEVGWGKLAGYDVYLDGVVVSRASSYTYTFTFEGLAPGSTHTMQVVATSGYGTHSEAVTITGATTQSS